MSPERCPAREAGAGHAHKGSRRGFRRVANASPIAVREVLRAVERHCREAAIPEEAEGRLQIVLAELLNNVVEHGHAGRPGGTVSVEVVIGGDAVRCVVHDDGAPMGDGPLGCAELPSVDVPLARLPEGGFGCAMVRMLARNLRYRRLGAINRTSFMLPFEAQDIPA